MTISQTILTQLGGGKFVAMTGARSMLDTGNGLRFDLPRGAAKNKATKIAVTLDPTDTYTVEFFQWNARKLELKSLAKVSNVYADSLRDVFTVYTGLQTSLGSLAA